MVLSDWGGSVPRVSHVKNPVHTHVLNKGRVTQTLWLSQSARVWGGGTSLWYPENADGDRETLVFGPSHWQRWTR